eukprot:m.279769 g.279769  ORF g.279769 m.279769 type:complete len:276 (-) comp16323_c11_seq57:34-861(-)
MWFRQPVDDDPNISYEESHKRITRLLQDTLDKFEEALYEEVSEDKNGNIEGLSRELVTECQEWKTINSHFRLCGKAATLHIGNLDNLEDDIQYEETYAKDGPPMKELEEQLSDALEASLPKQKKNSFDYYDFDDLDDDNEDFKVELLSEDEFDFLSSDDSGGFSMGSNMEKHPEPQLQSRGFSGTHTLPPRLRMQAHQRKNNTHRSAGRSRSQKSEERTPGSLVTRSGIQPDLPPLMPQSAYYPSFPWRASDSVHRKPRHLPPLAPLEKLKQPDC